MGAAAALADLPPVETSPSSERAHAHVSVVRPVPPAFEQVWDEHFQFVWRTARRLGIAQDVCDDVVQDVFLVVHRQLPCFEGRSSIKTWLFAITRRVVRDHRRSQARKPNEPLRDSVVDASAAAPAEQAARAQAIELLHALLDALDDEKREVFVLAELEQMSVPEIAESIGANVNTVYARLRAARKAFEQALARHRARMGRCGT